MFLNLPPACIAFRGPPKETHINTMGLALRKCTLEVAHLVSALLLSMSLSSLPYPHTARELARWVPAGSNCSG
jgi:hypothetical protein